MDCKQIFNLRFLAIAITAIFALPLWADSSALNIQQNNITMNNFRSAGIIHQDEKDKDYNWTMSGDTAHIENGIYHITNIDLSVIPIENENNNSQSTDKRFVDGEIKMKSPACDLNQNTSELHSSEYVNISSNTFTAEGIGYDVYMGNNQLIFTIRNAVKMVLPEATVNQPK